MSPAGARPTDRAPGGPSAGVRTRLRLSSRYENIEIAEWILAEVCAAEGWTHDDAYWVITALREALANAIRHGNRERPETRVHLEYRVGRSRAVVTVDDEGEGFDPDSVPDPTDPARLLEPSGRGIFYMKQFMSRVEFDDSPRGGTRVVMTRDLQPPQTRSTEDEE